MPTSLRIFFRELRGSVHIFVITFISLFCNDDFQRGKTKNVETNDLKRVLVRYWQGSAKGLS